MLTISRRQPKTCRKVALRAPLTRLGALRPLSVKRSAPTRFSAPLTPSLAQKRFFQTSADEAQKTAPQPIYLKDYKVPTHIIQSVGLHFDLGITQNTDEFSEVYSKLEIEPNPVSDASDTLVLKGGTTKDMILLSLSINGKELSPTEYTRTEKELTILAPPKGAFLLETKVRIKPQENTSLEGLYRSSGTFCTQCEAEGFRKITFYLDRPDVMSKFRVTITGDKEKYPVLLSNGNLVEQGDSGNGKHFAVWEDPFKKPAYLFAVVAGKLSCLESSFKTMSGRNVALKIYCEDHNLSKCDYAMQALKDAMKWDEDRFGLEYDLDLYNIVAIDDFNMGAMENKSLNVFNSKLVFANPKTATDADYGRIQGVIGHEYFHNWTGNRVTCRDWFQLSLKEGLTVFRDHEFSADLNSRVVQRISSVALLRQTQFLQDAGPMSHPVRPESYIKMDNFYTVTVYEKGAEVVRMYQSIFGVGGFRKGMDLYFKRHDGQAVTCDDFYQAMVDANNADLEGFKNWYCQAGTPIVSVDEMRYDSAKKTFTVTVRQQLREGLNPQLIPIATGLLNEKGEEMQLELEGDSGVPSGTKILKLKDWKQTFTFKNVQSEPVPSFLRNFSAPVIFNYEVNEQRLAFLLQHDSDEFNRWESAQKLYKTEIEHAFKGTGDIEASLKARSKESSHLLSALQRLLEGALNGTVDKMFASIVLAFPSEGELIQELGIRDPLLTHMARKGLQRYIAKHFAETFKKIVQQNEENGIPYQPDAQGKARRSLRNTCLHFLSLLEDKQIPVDLLTRCRSATNMTDQIAAFMSLVSIDSPERDTAISEFYQQWSHDKLVILKWYQAVASSNVKDNLSWVKRTWNSDFFDKKNPNSVYGLIGGLTASAINFHAESGEGYKFLADVVLELDASNPQVAARMVAPFTRWSKYDDKRQALMKAEAKRILDHKGLSENVFEVVSKTLAE